MLEFPKYIARVKISFLPCDVTLKNRVPSLAANFHIEHLVEKKNLIQLSHTEHFTNERISSAGRIGRSGN